MKYLRRVNGITRINRITKDKIREELKIEPIKQILEKNKLKWLSHLVRKNEEIPAKREWDAKV